MGVKQREVRAESRRRSRSQTKGTAVPTWRRGGFGDCLSEKWEVGEVLIGGRIWPFKGKE